jgi:hypothetical protein
VRLASVGVGELTGDEGDVASGVGGQVARASGHVADAGVPWQGRIPGRQAIGRHGGVLGHAGRTDDRERPQGRVRMVSVVPAELVDHVEHHAREARLG